MANQKQSDNHIWKQIVSCLFLLIFPVYLVAQNFTGKIIDTKGEPVAGSSVFIKETRQGLICNESGEFQTTLSSGTYHCEFSCLGYEIKNQEVVIVPSEILDLKITLNEKAVNLKEVVVDNSKEDPAYAIIRKAIEKAPFNLSRVKSYTSEAYLKGAGKLLEAPKIVEMLGGKDEINMYKNKMFLQESFNEIRFSAPDKYEQTVKAFSSTFPNNLDPKDVLAGITSNLYAPMFDHFVSPLNPKAFSYYNFRYEGFEENGQEIVNKIKIIPKLRDPKLMSGYLYIADNTWDIRHSELILNLHGGTRTFDITYNEVSDNIYLPTAYTIHWNVDLMGIKGFFDYLSSVKYTEVQLNDSLIAANGLPGKPKEKVKKSLEIKRDDKYKVESDSLATKRDSSFWTEVRNVPLNVEEIGSYIRKDTIQAFADSIENKHFHPEFKWMDLVMGGRLGGDSSNVFFKYGGLIEIAPEYNFVDGFWLGQKVELGFRPCKNSLLMIKPMAYWTWSREKLVWDVDMSFTYAPMRLGKFYLSGGSYSEDYIDNKGMLRIENALYSLFAGVNNAKLYEKNYIKAGNEIDVANGLNLRLEFEAADRKQLANHTTYSFFGDKDDVKPNVPDYPGDLNLNFNKLTKFTVHLKYRPEYYYSVENGRKYYKESRFPTFELYYQQGVSSGAGSSTFNRLDAMVHQGIRLGVFDGINYMINGGKFLNSNAFNYIDYKHFSTANQLITGKTFDEAFQLLDYYTCSTNDYWIQAQLRYGSEYLALKRLPFLQGKFFSEALLAKFLRIPDKSCYTEWGYSVGIRDLGTAGIFVSFDSFDYNSFGVSFSLPLLKEFKIK